MSKRWTDKEKELLDNNYPDIGPKGCAELLSRPESSVKSIANRRGLKYDSKSAWKLDEIEFLIEELNNGSTHEAIGVFLNRTKSSVMHKVQKLKLSSVGNSWAHLSDKELLQLVAKYKTAEEFDNNIELPSYKTIVKRFKASCWNEVKALAGLSVHKNTGRYDYTKDTIFYILEFTDIDGIRFKKYGVTQRSIELRYKGRRDFNVLYTGVFSLQEALDKETELAKLTDKYSPKDLRFTKDGHGGYTECFINYINVPEWINHG